MSEPGWRLWQRGLSGPVETPARCLYCKAEEFVDRPVNVDARRDTIARSCASCGRFLWWARWNGEQRLDPLTGDRDGVA